MTVAGVEPAVVAIGFDPCAGTERPEAVGPDVAQPPVADVALALAEVSRRAGHDLAGRGDDARDAAGAASEGDIAIEAVVAAGAAPFVVEFDVKDGAKPPAETRDSAQLPRGWQQLRVLARSTLGGHQVKPPRIRTAFEDVIDHVGEEVGILAVDRRSRDDFRDPSSLECLHRPNGCVEA